MLWQYQAYLFDLPAPVPGEKAMEAATEQYGFCRTLWSRNRMTRQWGIFIEKGG